VDAGFPCADANGLFELGDENLAVADPAGLGRVFDCCRDRVDLCGVQRDLEFELGQEVNGVFGAAIDFGMALLTAVALDLGDGHAVDVEKIEGLADLLEPRRFYDGDQQFHVCSFPRSAPDTGGFDSKAVPNEREPPQAFGTKENRSGGARWPLPGESRSCSIFMQT